MFFIYLTQIVLDVSFNLSWWLCKQTGYIFYDGVVYMIYGKQVTVNDLQNEILLLKHEIHSIKNEGEVQSP